MRFIAMYFWIGGIDIVALYEFMRGFEVTSVPVAIANFA